MTPTTRHSKRHGQITAACILSLALTATVLAAPAPLLGTGTRVVALGDLDGDGLPEFATIPGGLVRELEIVCADDAKVLWRTEGHDAATIPDQDGDGFPDVVVAQRYGKSTAWLAIHQGVSGKRLSTVNPKAADGEPVASDDEKARTESVIVLGDVTGDARPELLVVRVKDAYAMSQSTTKWSAGSAAFVIELDGTVVADLGAVAPDDVRSPVAAPAGDLDGDGRPELFVCVASKRGYLPIEVRDLEGETVHRFKGAAKGAPPTLARACHDIDGDGVGDLALGFPHDARGKKSNAGRLVLYSGKTGKQIHVLRGGNERDQFGAGFVSFPDIDGDAVPDFAVGAPGMRTAASFRGAVVAYSGKSGKPIWTADIGDEGSDFGYALDALGDVDADGVSDLVAGAPGGVDPRDFGRAVVLSGKTGKVRVIHAGERR